MVTVEVDPQVGKDFIEHFGTRGMKWGVRRTRAERAAGSGKSDEKAKPKTSVESKKVVGKTNTNKKASELSDAQLKKVNERLNLEQTYAKLTAPPPTRTQKLLATTGKLATGIVTQVAAQEVKSLINNPTTSKIGKMLDKQKRAKVPKAPKPLPFPPPKGDRFV
jgi:hypothetical protein